MAEYFGNVKSHNPKTAEICSITSAFCTVGCARESSLFCCAYLSSQLCTHPPPPTHTPSHPMHQTEGGGGYQHLEGAQLTTTEEPALSTNLAPRRPPFLISCFCVLLAALLSFVGGLF